MTIQNEENDVPEFEFKTVELEKLSQKMLIDIVENMAIRLSEEVDAGPEDLISVSYQHAKDNAPRFRVEVDRGHNGYNGEYKSLDDAFTFLKRYQESFPTHRLVITLTPINL